MIFRVIALVGTAVVTTSLLVLIHTTNQAVARTSAPTVEVYATVAEVHHTISDIRAMIQSVQEPTLAIIHDVQTVACSMNSTMAQLKGPVTQTVVETQHVVADLHSITTQMQHSLETFHLVPVRKQLKKGIRCLMSPFKCCWEPPAAQYVA